MNEMDIEKSLEKLRYQVSILAQTVDHEAHPVETLILGMDWTAGDLSKAHDIFQRWDERLQKGEKVEQAAFERDFDRELGISYQGVKSVVLAFYRNGQWTDVIESFVDGMGSSPSAEYLSIKRRNERNI